MGGEGKKTNKYNLATNCIILAGGKSSRLGSDKALVTVGDKSLLRQVISCVDQLCEHIIIVTDQERTFPQFADQTDLRTATDTFPGKGPLGGIYTGLAISDSFYNLVVACDMPFLNQGLLRYMIELSADSDMVIPRLGNQVEPLHAVYTKNCLASIENLIKQDKLNISELCRLVRVRYVEAEEIEGFDPMHLSFFNINTKADLKKARELAGGDSEQ